MQIKICGLKYPSNIESVSLLKPDYCGFIFYPKSKRFAEDFLIPKQMIRIAQSVPTIGVFVDAEIPTIMDKVKLYDLKSIQLHGNESPLYCRQLREFIKEVSIIKAFGISESFNFELLTSYIGFVDSFLFDRLTLGKGGSGNVFDWEILKSYHLNIPYFLSGGIGSQEMDLIKALITKKDYFKNLMGLDMNSKLEDCPGMKNLNLVKEAINGVKNF